MKTKYMIIPAALAFVAACSDREPEAPGAQQPLGSDRDAHGCIGSAGYQWCAKTETCERPWELAEKAGFENTEEGFASYCGK